MSRDQTLSTEESEAARAIIQKLVEDWKNKSPGRTQGDFADLTGWSKSTLSNYLRPCGTKITRRAVWVFSQVLDVKPEEISAAAAKEIMFSHKTGIVDTRQMPVLTMSQLAERPADLHKYMAEVSVDHKLKLSPRSFAITVEDSSLDTKDPDDIRRAKQGDCIIVDPEMTPNIGEPVLALIGEIAVLRIYSGDTLTALHDSGDYPPIPINMHCKIIGVAAQVAPRAMISK